MISENKLNLAYRPDIDGLRALAVLLVIGFHAFPTVISGGFIGVDIFFVISGYLITSIIIKKLNDKRFSFIEFYASRTRRIFPALIIVLIASGLLGLFILQEDEFARLIKHIVGGSAFVLNYILASEGGYFDRLAESKPLLHLWSLGVEEQFYLLWPFILWVFWSFHKKTWVLIIILFMISFALNIMQIQIKPIDTFYSLQTRFWELLVGAGLAYVGSSRSKILPTGKRSQNITSLVGITIITFAVVIIDSHTLFPGLWALLPTIGAAFLIVSNANGFINRYFLSNRIMVWIGLISYPLYLWHWPIFAFYRVHFSGHPTASVRFLLIIFSIVIASLTYYWVERPIRTQINSNRTAFNLFLMLATVFGISLYLNNYPIQKNQKNQDEKSAFYSYFADVPAMRWLTFFEKEFRHECNFYQIDEYYSARPTNKPKAKIDNSCFSPDENKKYRILIWGDSHAQMLNSGLKKELPNDWQVMQIASSGCAARIDNLQLAETDYCAYSNKFALDVIAKAAPNVVIIAQSVGHNIQSMDKIDKYLKQLGVHTVIFVGPSPQWEDDLPKIIIRRLWPNIPERTWVGVNKDVYEKNLKLKNKFTQNSNKIYIDAIGLFCNSDGCLTRLGADSKKDSTSWDYGHLTEAASAHLAKELLVPQIIKSIN